MHFDALHAIECATASHATGPADVVPCYFIPRSVEDDPARQRRQIPNRRPDEYPDYRSDPLTNAESRCGSDGLYDDTDDATSRERRNHPQSVR